MRLRLLALLRQRMAEGPEDERGAVLVVFAVALATVMGLAAMAVDLGNIAQTKAHTETAVQDAALSAVPELSTLYVGGSGNAATQEDEATEAAERYLILNYAGLTSADFTSTSCAGMLPASITFSATTDCVGFFNPVDPSLDATHPSGVAVAVPPRQVRYSFGRAVGLSQQPVSSEAFAVLKPAIGNGGLPFSYTAGGGITGLQCIKTGSGTKAGACTGFATGSGQFGVINSPRYRVFPGYDNAGGNDAVIETDLDLGIDHALNVFGAEPAGSLPVCDMNPLQGSCNATVNGVLGIDNGTSPAYYDWANFITPQTGQTQNDVTAPLFDGNFTTPSGGCTLEPLLAHPDGFATSPSCSADNPTSGPAGPYLSSPGDMFNAAANGYPDLNGRQISYYLDANGQDLTSSACAGNLPAGDNATNTPIDAGGTGTGNVWFGGSYPNATYPSYDACLAGVMAGLVNPLTDTANQAIFSSTIERSPRFGQVPIIASSSGSNPEEIVGFLDVYLDIAFGNNNVDSIAAWVFPPSMVENGTGYLTGGTDYQGGAYIPFLCSFTGNTCA